MWKSIIEQMLESWIESESEYINGNDSSRKDSETMMFIISR